MAKAPKGYPKDFPKNFPKMKKGWFKETPDGWKDLGEVVGCYDPSSGKNMTPICSYCNNRLRVGVEGGIKFKFCSVCKSLISGEVKKKNK